MRVSFAQAPQWLLGPEAPAEDRTTHLLPRWIFLRALGIIWFSAFYSLIFQIKGLIGPQGLLPASEFLANVARYFGGWEKFWYAPSVFWWSSTDRALMMVCGMGLIGSVGRILNFWPRAGLPGCWVG